VVGLVGAAGLFCALVPGAMLLTTCATMLAKNVYQDYVPGASDTRVTSLARLCVPLVTAIALFLTFKGGNAIVNLLLLGYAFVTQLFPAMITSLLGNNPVTKWGAGAGMLTGTVVVAWLTLGEHSVGDVFPFVPSTWEHLNVGIVALLANIVVCAAVSAATRQTSRTTADAVEQPVPVA
jgi:SSS family solute:Na+ symporter